jgi:Arc/MetJ-type ribon-helix-helix transcriptional regulator
MGIYSAMTISLARDVEEFLQAQMRGGVCSDASDLVNDVLRAVRDQQSQHLPLSNELEAWLLEAADDPGSPLRVGDFADIRTRVQARVSPLQK